MKRVVSWILVIIVLVNIVPVLGYAAENDREVVYFEDGSYMLVEIITSNVRASGSKTGSKQYTYYDSDDVSQWKAVLTGKFTYTGSDATCTSSSVSTTIYNSSWYTVSKSAGKSGNKATASVVMGYNLEGVTMSRVPVSLTLSCDANGNLS
nr:hypothetical protein [Oscillospiraceae bacterium]